MKGPMRRGMIAKEQLPELQSASPSTFVANRCPSVSRQYGAEARLQSRAVTATSSVEFCNMRAPGLVILVDDVVIDIWLF